MSDYDRIAQVIRYIELHRDEQPDLKTLASVIGLSTSHFHRLFSRWAGISPKDFLQSLTLEYARERLKEGDNILNASLDCGLSGPGRLHDLCITFESASPGEIKTGGDGWSIRAGMAASPFGECLIAEGPRGICHLSFSNDWKRLQKDWPNAAILRDDQRAGVLAEHIFVGGSMKLRSATKPPASLRPLKLFVRGTEFQVRVWRALLEIPEGCLVSYGRLARLTGSSSAPRAVGSAIGHNPIGYLIPCHRVIRQTGAAGGYAWGVERKRAIQSWEALKR